MNHIFVILFELSINIFESYLMIDFISRFNGFKYKCAKKSILYIIAIFIIFTNVTTANYYESFIEIANYISILIMIIYSVIALEGKLLKKLLSCILFNAVLILINSFSLFIFGMIFNVSISTMIKTFGIYRFTCLITSKIILFYASKIILKIKINKYEKSPIYSWILITIMPLLTIFIMVTITESAIINNSIRITFYLFLSIIGLILTNTICYFLFIKLGKEYEISIENKILKQNIKLSNKHSLEIKQLYKEIQTMRHDMKNQLISIQSCFNEKNYERGIEFTNSIIESIEITKKYVFTKNDMFNAIVNNKFSEANSKGIKTRYSINYELDNQIEDSDINILFGNLLDNAIEACEKLDINKEIDLLINKKRDYIFIEVKNTISKSVLKENPNLITSKHDKSSHGIGVKSIKNVVKKYNGIIDYKEYNSTFSCKILLLEKN